MESAVRLRRLVGCVGSAGCARIRRMGVALVERLLLGCSIPDRLGLWRDTALCSRSSRCARRGLQKEFQGRFDRLDRLFGAL